MAGKMFDVSGLVKAIKKKQKTIDKNSRKLKTAPKYITIGWDEKSGTYPEQGGKPVALIAKIHNDGTEHHDAKEMIENTIFLHQDQWIAAYKKFVSGYLSKGKVPNHNLAVEKVGRMMKTDLTNFVYAIDLVDTERLANSVIIRYHRR